MQIWQHKEIENLDILEAHFWITWIMEFKAPNLIAVKEKPTHYFNKTYLN